MNNPSTKEKPIEDTEIPVLDLNLGQNAEAEPDGEEMGSEYDIEGTKTQALLLNNKKWK